MSGEKTLVLNSSYQFVGIVDWQKAISQLYQGDAEVLHEWDSVVNDFVPISYERTVANFNKRYVWKIPAIIRLFNNNVFVNRVKNLKYSKINVFHRDNYICQFCGYKWDGVTPVSKGKKLTVDHVFPVSLGGKSSFENCVTACQECNFKKGNKTLLESGMKLMRKPVTPSMGMLIKRRLKKKKVHSSWEPYLNDSMNGILV